MRGFLVTALAATVAVFVFAGPKPASALPAGVVVNHTQANADLVEVKKYKYKKRYKKGRYYRGPRYGGRYYGRGYYGRGYYNRPYGYYGRPYYRRRPGVTIWW
jgi:hypothetical protein